MQRPISSRFLPRAALLSLVLVPAAAAQVRPDAVLLRTPDVSRDQICFRYDGDVWLVDKRGGEARRLSSPPGNETLPRFSPDGQRIAFMGGYEGGTDLYVLGLDGGLPTRLTHHPDTELLCDWLPGGEGLLFFSSMTSGQARAPKLFTVPTEGGQPVELPLPFGAFGAIDPSGHWLAYTPFTHSEFATWRRYQGGNAQDIWLFDLRTRESRRVTDWPGDDALPMWNGEGLIFLSDRGSERRLNLWSYDLKAGTFAQLTEFGDFDVRFPSIGPEDVVFEKGGKLWRYELQSRRSVPVEVLIPGDRPRLAARTVGVEELMADAEIGPEAKRVVVEARGELYSLPVEEGVVRNLTATDGVAEREPAWSPDGQWIAYFSDASGEYELCLRRGDGRKFRWQGAGEEVAERSLSEIGPSWKSELSWAPDSKSVAFCTNDGELHRLVIESGELLTLDKSPEGEPFEVDWSPDSRWLAYSHRHSRSRLPALYLFDLEAGARHELTAGMFADDRPVFDRGGRWLFFRSSRTFEPIYEDLGDTWIYTNSQNLMAVPLRKDVENPFRPSSEEEGAAEEKSSDDESDKKSDEKEDESKDEKKGDDEEGKDSKSKDEPPPAVAIELEGFEQRILALPMPAGRFESLAGSKGKLFYLRLPRTGAVASEGGDEDEEDGVRSGATLCFFDLEAKKKEREEKTVLAGVQGFSLAAKADKALVALGDGKLAVIDLAPDQKAEEHLDLSGLVATVDPRREWAQILADAGRIMRDFFYDPQMHGVDWDAVVSRYRGALSYATSRDDLHYLIGEMIAELNVGHAYNSGPPQGLQRAAPGRGAGLLGCDWANERGGYRIARILRGEAAETDGRSPLAVPGIDAREGDWLLAVNGVPLDATRDVYAAFEGLAGKPTELLLNAAPGLDGNERRVLVEPIASERELRYRDWVARARAEVERLSGGRVGYVHVPDTGQHGQTELVRQFLGQMHREALLVDERWNGGGQVPTRFIELLQRPATNYWAVRHGEDWPWPPVAHFGPKAMLINYASGSGGDCFPYYFRQSGLGKLIGTRTWGGLVGLSGNPDFVDGASISVPRFAFYELDGTWGVEGHGVAPDIEVIEDPALMQDGRDPQLIAGVEHLLAELASQPYLAPKRPGYPDRSGVGIAPADR